MPLGIGVIRGHGKVMKHRSVSEMVRDQVVISLPPDATAREAARVMADRRIGAVLITQDGLLLGIFTERDMVARVVALGRDPDHTELSAVMTAKPRTVDHGASTAEALRTMQQGGFRHLPVTKRGRIAGILSLRDFASSDLLEIERAQDLERAIAEGGLPSG